MYQRELHFIPLKGHPKYYVYLRVDVFLTCVFVMSLSLIYVYGNKSAPSIILLIVALSVISVYKIVVGFCDYVLKSTQIIRFKGGSACPMYFEGHMRIFCRLLAYYVFFNLVALTIVLAGESANDKNIMGLCLILGLIVAFLTNIFVCLADGRQAFRESKLYGIEAQILNGMDSELEL